MAEYDKNEWVVQTRAWRWLETVWDANHAVLALPTPKIQTEATYLDLYGIDA